MGVPKWMSAVWAAIAQAMSPAAKALSQYGPEYPLVVLRRAHCVIDDALEQKVSDEGTAQLAAAIEAMTARYGGEAVFQVYAVCSSFSHGISRSAKRLYELLGIRAHHVGYEWILVTEFLAKVQLRSDVILVVVSNEPSVMDLLMKVYGTSDPAKVDYTIEVPPQFGVPYFLNLKQAKDPTITMPGFVATDGR